MAAVYERIEYFIIFSLVWEWTCRQCVSLDIGRNNILSADGRTDGRSTNFITLIRVYYAGSVKISGVYFQLSLVNRQQFSH